MTAPLVGWAEVFVAVGSVWALVMWLARLVVPRAFHRARLLLLVFVVFGVTLAALGLLAV